MTSKKSSHNLSLAMFRQSAFKVCFLPLTGFAAAVLYMIYQFVNIVGFNHDVIYFTNSTGFYFDDVRDFDLFLNVYLIGIAFISAAILFGFNWSKKQTNVIYSLGISRKNIYLSRMLAGLLPALAVLLLITAFETLNNIWVGFTPDVHYWKMVLLTDLSWYSVYALSFILCSVVFSATGNFIEGSIFSLAFALFPSVFNEFLFNCAYMYTLGNTENIDFSGKWCWCEPFFLNEVSGFVDSFSDGMTNYPDMYFSKSSTVNLDIFDFSSPITATVLAIIIFAVGLVAFKKHRNEIAGTWGRANGITEIAAAVVSFFSFSTALSVISYDTVSGNGGVLHFVLCLVSFLFTMIVFKLIFSSKRAKSIKKSFIRFPIYAAGLGAVTLVFYCGMFGYSSYVPEASQVQFVEVETTVTPYYTDAIAGSSYYGLKSMHFGKYEYNTHSAVQAVIFNDEQEIKDIIKLHGRIVDNGKIKDSADDACLYPITITYKLTNGKSVKREYNESNEETAKMIMMLSDYKERKEKLEDFLNSTAIQGNINLDARLNVILNKNIRLENENADIDLSETFPFGEEYIACWVVFEGEKCIGAVYVDPDSQMFYVDSDSRMYIGNFDESWYDYEDSSLSYMDTKNCYLYSKDMTEGYALGLADKELFEAIKKDMVNQTAEQYFMHKSEDELGIITFGRSETYYGSGMYGFGEAYMDDSAMISYTDEEDEDIKPGSKVRGTSWNLNSNDNFAFVVTKDMKNTVKYLESKNYMQYLTAERKLDDIKSIKTATLSELYGKRNNSSNIPIFFSAYWTSGTVKAMTEELRGGDIYNYHMFEAVKEKITDKDKIGKLLDNSLLFGFCPNNYRIVEIEYKDGSLATVLVSADAYNDIMS